MDNMICVLCKKISSGIALCSSKAFCELEYMKGDIFVHRCHLTDLWIVTFAMPPKAGIARTLVLLVKALPGALLCQELSGHGTAVREGQGLDASSIQCFREVIIHSS